MDTSFGVVSTIGRAESEDIRPIVLTCQAMSDTAGTRAPRASGAATASAAATRSSARRRELATVEGIDGLSIARLADAVGMSKSGLFAHFGSKEELQLATIETAGAMFAERGGRSRRRRPHRASSGSVQLAEGFLRHVEGDVFPGGCFFASVAAELDTHPGPVRDLAVAGRGRVGWLLETAVRDAQAEGAIDAVRGRRAARLRARRLPAARERAVRDQPAADPDRARARRIGPEARLRLHTCNAVSTATPIAIAQTPASCTRVRRSWKSTNAATAATAAN